MRKSLLLVLLLTLLSAGTFGYIASQLLPVRDQVAVQQNIQFGDPSALNGLTVSLLTESDNILHWNTTIETGTDVNAVTDYTYTIPPEKVDSRREQTNWLTISPSIWSIPALQEYDAQAGEKYPKAYESLAEGLEPGESASGRVYVKDFADYYSLTCSMDLLDERFTFYKGEPTGYGSDFQNTLAKRFHEEFLMKVPDYLQMWLEISYDDRYYNYNYSCEPVGGYDGEFTLDVAETMADSGFWFTFNTSDDDYTRLDVSHFPNGYGIWRIPVENGSLQPELEMVYPLTPGIKILNLTTSADGRKILLSTMEENQVQITVLDSRTAETLQQIPLVQLPEKDASWCFYEADGCIVAALIDTVSRSRNLILLAENEKQEYEVLWNLQLNDNNSPVVYFHKPEERHYEYSYDYWPVMAWNGEQLAFAMANYRLAMIDVAVYDKDGLACYATCDTSLNRNPCSPAAFDPLALTWN